MIFLIRLSNGYEFEFMASSGALGWDGRGWKHPKYFFVWWLLSKLPDLIIPVTKTLTLYPQKGQSRAIYDGKDFVVNAVGLANPGIVQWREKYLPKIKNRKIIISITEETILKVEKMIIEIEKAIKENENVMGVEFNVSCPNIHKIWLPQDIFRACKKIKTYLDLPLGLKIGYQQDYLKIAKKTQGLVEWLSFNAIPWEIIFQDRESPLEKKFGLKGAVSGKVIQKFNEKMALKIKLSGIKTPVVLSSVGWGRNFQEGYENLCEALKWADAVSFGSLFRKHPTWPIKLALRYQKEKAEKIKSSG